MWSQEYLFYYHISLSGTLSTNDSMLICETKTENIVAHVGPRKQGYGNNIWTKHMQNYSRTLSEVHMAVYLFIYWTFI